MLRTIASSAPSRRLSPIGIVVIASCLSCDSAGRAGKSTSTRNFADDSRPRLFVYSLPGYPGPKDTVRAGLLIAVWADGRVVRVRNPDSLGQAYVQGRIGETDLSHLNEELDRLAQSDRADEGNAVIDAPSEQLVLRLGRQVRIWELRNPSSSVGNAKRIRDWLIGVSVLSETNADAATYSQYPHDWYVIE